MDNYNHLEDLINAIFSFHGDDEDSGPEEVPKQRYEPDPIKEACTAYCEAHNCSTCDLRKSVAIKKDGFCVVGMIAGLSQPVESAISLAMKWHKEKESAKESSYMMDYFAKNAGAEVAHAVGHSYPAVCREDIYPEAQCTGDKPCWLCWREMMPK